MQARDHSEREHAVAEAQCLKALEAVGVRQVDDARDVGGDDEGSERVHRHERVPVRLQRCRALAQHAIPHVHTPADGHEKLLVQVRPANRHDSLGDGSRGAAGAAGRGRRRGRRAAAGGGPPGGVGAGRASSSSPSCPSSVAANAEELGVPLALDLNLWRHARHIWPHPERAIHVGGGKGVDARQDRHVAYSRRRRAPERSRRPERLRQLPGRHVPAEDLPGARAAIEQMRARRGLTRGQGGQGRVGADREAVIHPILPPAARGVR